MSDTRGDLMRISRVAASTKSAVVVSTTSLTRRTTAAVAIVGGLHDVFFPCEKENAATDDADTKLIPAMQAIDLLS